MRTQDPFAPFADCLVSEEAFDWAFSRLGATERAWIKKNIAQLHTLYFDQAGGSSCWERSWSQGFYSRQEKTPCRASAVCFPADFHSPARMVAAVLPPLASGAKRFCAVRVGTGDPSWDPILLGALELAGVEEVYDMDPERYRQWLEMAGGDPSVRLELLEDEQGILDREGGLAGGALRLPPVRELGIWFQESGQWDLAALQSAHPGIRLMCGSAEKSCLPQGEKTFLGSLSEFAAQGFDALYVPKHLFREAMAHCCRVLGPGQEGCWIWPEISGQHFAQTKLCLSSAIREDPFS